MSRPQRKESRTPGSRKHARQPSDTSAIADSTISFTGLSLFPNPPESIPSTPSISEFGSPSPTRSAFTTRSSYTKRVPVPQPPRDASSAAETSHSQTSVPGPSRIHASQTNRTGEKSPSSPYARTISPYDWHEGASSIDVDAAEDRLLSTSFITNLLQESDDSSGRRTRHNSLASDAFSGISEMTYPPSSRYPDPNDRPPLPSLPQVPSFPVRIPTSPRGGRPPPSSFAPIPESSGQISDDSDTVYSLNDQYIQVQPTVIRSASRTRALGLRGASVLGMAPARTLSMGSASATTAYSASHGPGDGQRLTVVAESDSKVSLGGLEYVRSSVPFSPALPSTAGTRAHFLRDSSRTSVPQTRQSVHSTRSYAPSLISKISSTGRSVIRAITWKRKPLPPVPTIPHIPISVEAENRAAESSVPLPDLVTRASTLSGMLEKGYHPHHSLTSYALKDGLASTFDQESRDGSNEQMTRYRGSLATPPAVHGMTPSDSPKIRDGGQKKKRLWIIISVFSVIALGAVGAGVGVSVSRNSANLPACEGTMAGTNCNLNGTCVCTSSFDGRCEGLAQNLVDLTPTMNQLFSVNYTLNDVYGSIWVAQGSGSSSSCASQAVLVDVAPGVDATQFPGRAAWAQSALLWTLVRSQDTDDADTLKEFISQAPWEDLGGSDGPVESTSGSFTTTVSGYTFDFGSQTLSQPSIKFEEDGQPTSSQIDRVGDTATAALDRMYSLALASSTQRQSALSSYWRNTLLQDEADLRIFLSAFAGSDLLAGFDATAESVRQLWNTTETFPPSAACYPDLNSSVIEQINGIESKVFQLSPAQAISDFDSSCYPERPVYGVLDLLRLRLPFIDSRTGAAKQAVKLVENVKPRAVIYSGEALAALPADFVRGMAPSDSREYGTFNHLNHIILNYLKAMPSVDIARAFATYMLSSPVTPPQNDTILAQSLSSIPVVEVAVFGVIPSVDVSEVRSSLTTPSGSLFFGSSQGEELREWAIRDSQHSIVWTESALSQQVSRDSMSDDTFENIWSAAARIIRSDASVDGNVVDRIVDSLRSTGKLSTN